MAEVEKPKVETSIELIDNVTTVANDIMEKLDAIATKYEEVNNRLSGGLTIGYTNTTNTIENMYTNASNKISTSLKNRIVGTLGDLEKYNQLIKEANLEQERHARVSSQQAKERDAQRAQRQKLTLSKPKQQKEVLSQSTTSAESKANKLYFKSFEEKLRYFERDNNLKSMANHEQERHANELISQSATRISQSWERISITRARNAEKEMEKNNKREQKELNAINDMIIKQEKLEEDARRKEEKFYNNMIQMLDKHDVKMGINKDNFDFDTKKREGKLKYDREKALQKKADEDRKYAHEQRMLRLQKEKHRENLYYNQERKNQAKMRALEKSVSYIGKSGREQLLEGIKKDIKHNKDNVVRSSGLQSGLNAMFGIMDNIFMSIFNADNIRKAIDTSDRLVTIKSRLDLLNQSFNKINGTDESTDSLMDYVYKASQNARVKYYDMADTIANMGTYSNDVFTNQKEVVDFTNLMYKVLRTNGINGDNATASVKQIVASINSGALRGEQLMSLLKKAPSVINMVTETLGVSVTELEKVARERNLSSRAIKDIFFVNAEKINEQFEKIPMTWSDIGTKISNFFLELFEPILLKINALANNKNFMENLERVTSDVIRFVSAISDAIIYFVSIIVENWAIIEPILYSLAIVFTIMKLISVVKMFSGALSGLLAIFTNPYIAGILLATVAFAKLSGVLEETNKSAWKCGQGTMKMSDGIIASINAIIYTIYLGVAGIGGLAIGTIYAILKPLKSFYDLGKSIGYLFQGNFSEAKNSLKDAGNDWRFFKNYNEGFQYATGGNYYDKTIGEVYADTIWKRVNDRLSIEQGKDYLTGDLDLKKYLDDMLSEMKKGNASLDITTEDLKYMRDIAERDNINRFTTAEIKVDMQNNNNINNNMDIDGVVSQLAEGIEEAMYVVAEGVY